MPPAPLPTMTPMSTGLAVEAGVLRWPRARRARRCARPSRSGADRRGRWPFCRPRRPDRRPPALRAAASSGTAAATRQVKCDGIELGDRARAAHAPRHVIPEHLAADAERRHDADAGNRDARRTQPCRSYNTGECLPIRSLLAAVALLSRGGRSRLRRLARLLRRQLCAGGSTRGRGPPAPLSADRHRRRALLGLRAAPQRLRAERREVLDRQRRCPPRSNDRLRLDRERRSSSSACGAWHAGSRPCVGGRRRRPLGIDRRAGRRLVFTVYAARRLGVLASRRPRAGAPARRIGTPGRPKLDQRRAVRARPAPDLPRLDAHRLAGAHDDRHTLRVCGRQHALPGVAVPFEERTSAASSAPRTTHYKRRVRWRMRAVLCH